MKHTCASLPPPFLLQPGTFTWPIVALTYIYVRQDLTYLSGPSAHLLKAFLTALYMPEYNEVCAEEFGFVPVTGELKEKAEAAIQGLTTSGGTDWYFELSTEVGTGQGDYVFSVKRDSYSEIEQDQLVKQVAALMKEVAALKGSAVDMGDDDRTETGFMNSGGNEDDQDQNIMAALVLGAIACSLWILALIGFLVKCVLNI